MARPLELENKNKKKAEWSTGRGTERGVQGKDITMVKNKQKRLNESPKDIKSSVVASL